MMGGQAALRSRRRAIALWRRREAPLPRIIHETLKSVTERNRANPHPDPPAPRLRRAGPLPWKGRWEISSPRVRGEDQGEGQFVAQKFMNKSGYSEAALHHRRFP